MKKYRKKPMVVEAIQWNGVNRGEIESFCGYENVEFKVEILIIVATILLRAFVANFIHVKKKFLKKLMNYYQKRNNFLFYFILYNIKESV